LAHLPLHFLPLFLEVHQRAALAEVAALAILALLLLRTGQIIHRAGEAALLLCGLFWFVLRLRG